MDGQSLLFLTAAVFIVMGGIFVVASYFRLGKKRSKTPYVKQLDFFGSGEFRLFATLSEVCGDKYLVFPHVHLGRLLDVKQSVDYKEVSNQRSRIDRKPADFVICSRETGAVLVLIDLGSERHNFGDKKTRDKFIEDLAQIEGLPLLYLKTGMNADTVRAELQKVLPDL